eukprot:3036571-Rhodomonas_salina.2
MPRAVRSWHSSRPPAARARVLHTLPRPLQSTSSLPRAPAAPAKPASNPARSSSPRRTSRPTDRERRRTPGPGRGVRRTEKGGCEIHV